MAIMGVDISEWNGEVDFNLLKTDKDFAFIRVSAGVGKEDNQVGQNRDKALKAGMPHGLYHYSYGQYNTPEAEAEYFLSLISPLPGELLALDIEEPIPDPVGWSLRWLNFVYARTGVKPLLYTNLATASRYNWLPVMQADYGLWLALWDYNPDGDSGTTVWDSPAIRQYSNRGSAAGISGLVDLNVFYGGREAFMQYGYQVPAPAPQSSPTPQPLVSPDGTLDTPATSIPSPDSTTSMPAQTSIDTPATPLPVPAPIGSESGSGGGQSTIPIPPDSTSTPQINTNTTPIPLPITIIKTVPSSVADPGFFGTTIGKVVKTITYLTLSAGLASLTSLIANDPYLLGPLTPLFNVLLVTLKNLFDKNTPNI